MILLFTLLLHILYTCISICSIIYTYISMHIIHILYYYIHILALKLFLNDNGGGKQHCLIPFVGSNLGVERFLEKMEHQKRMLYYRGLRHLVLYWGFTKILCKACLLFNCFLVIKGILKVFFSFIPWWLISLVCLTLAQIWGN